MPFKKRRGRRKRRGKWRQQRLAVGTVERISRSIAKQEDKKQLKKYVHTTQIILAGAPDMISSISLPPKSQWFVNPGAAFQWRLLSDLGNKVRDANVIGASPAVAGEVELRIHGIQVYGICTNNAPYPCKFQLRIIYIPNLNSFTTGAVDYLVPSETMLFKSRSGLGSLLYRGYDHKNLGTMTATGIPVKYTELAKKVVSLPAAFARGQDTLPDATVTQTTRDERDVRRHFSLSAYFKGMGKKAYARTTQQQLSDGNYFLVYWNDLASISDTVSFASSVNLQYSLKNIMGSSVT